MLIRRFTPESHASSPATDAAVIANPSDAASITIRKRTARAALNETRNVCTILFHIQRGQHVSSFSNLLKVVGPTVVLGLLVMSESIGNRTSRGWVVHDLMTWLSETIGPVPAGLIFIGAGLAWSYSAYVNLSSGR